MSESLKHKQFVDSLSEAERMLIGIRDELYAGSWNRMAEDLRDRLNGKPYIFKLVNQIEADLKRIEKLAAYEEEQDINVANYL